MKQIFLDEQDQIMQVYERKLVEQGFAGISMTHKDHCDKFEEFFGVRPITDEAGLRAYVELSEEQLVEWYLRWGAR